MNIWEKYMGWFKFFIKNPKCIINLISSEMDKLQASIRGRENVDEETIKVIEEKFESLIPYFQSAKNTGLTFINDVNRVSYFQLSYFKEYRRNFIYFNSKGYTA